MSSTVDTATEIRPFRVDVPKRSIDELRRRIDATRWPTKELVADRSQGVQLATTQELARYWTTDYDWRRCEARLNALPQFKTMIDGLDIHFIHVKSPHENALPLIMTHGWPGSVVELLETIGPLTDPTAHGGQRRGRVRPRAAVHSRLRLLRRADRARLGSQPHRAGVGRAHAAPRLHPVRRPGRRRGLRRSPTRWAARRPDGLLGIHTEPAHAGAGDRGATDRRRLRAGTRRARPARHVPGDGFGYFVEQATRPETIGYALLDSPVALAAWIIDHDTDSYEKIARAFVDKQPTGNLTRDHIVDNLTVYWLTRTGASAARSYWENGQAQARAAGQAPPSVSIPVGFTTFPGEIWRTPRSWVEKAYPDVVYFNEVDKGGHFAAWEEPQLFSEETCAPAFRPLRSRPRERCGRRRPTGTDPLDRPSPRGRGSCAAGSKVAWRRSRARRRGSTPTRSRPRICAGGSSSSTSGPTPASTGCARCHTCGHGPPSTRTTA